MNLKKEKAKANINELVSRFHEHIETYKKGGYNEEQTRVDYINPFFEALGWDVSNKEGVAESYREVIHEDKIKVGSSTKSVDYCFKVSDGPRKFFVDAKKPSIDIKQNAAPAFQVRRYGWSAKVSISIVTDFEEFAVYDCRQKPNVKDKASHSRICYFTYKDYEKKFDFLFDTFSKDAVLKGKFDTYTKSNVDKSGTSEVDSEFLKTIEQWREQLAKNIALRNKNLTEEELNEVVQKNIDRLIFLRVAEDRGVENYERLSKTLKSKNIFQSLLTLYQEADDKYNAGLFDLKKDTLIKKLVLDEKILKEIITNFYYPKSPYEFSVISSDILGKVYEKFLGKVVRLTPSHQVKIEEKPEVRKAGGVYYTPKIIVETIIEKTVGKILEKKTPKQIEKIKILDPACGSGSFLIEVYDLLLKWHLDYYVDFFKGKEDTKSKKEAAKILTPNKKLKTEIKKKILLNNIFGVDIDSQAVEVTKLNLLLKCLEGETQSSVKEQILFLHERILPNLKDNIKSGNTLVSPKFYSGTFGEIDPKMIKKINVFDWKNEFEMVFKQSGFDCIVGNPPYIQLQKFRGEPLQEAMKQEGYKTYNTMGDIYTLFYEKGMNLLKPKGILGYITSNKWMKAGYGKELQNFCVKDIRLKELIDFSGTKVFKEVTVDVNIAILENLPPHETFEQITPAVAPKENQWKNNPWGTKVGRDAPSFETASDLRKYIQKNKYPIAGAKNEVFLMLTDAELALKKKVEKIGKPLKEWEIQINRGVLTGYNEAFIIDKAKRDELIGADPKNEAIIKPILRGKDVKRYHFEFAEKYLIVTHNGYKSEMGKIIPRIDVHHYFAVKNHLKQYDKALKKRQDKGDTPYNLRSCKYWEDFEKEKIVYSEISQRPSFYFDKKKFFVPNTAYIIVGEHLKYLTTMFNSKAVTYFYKQFYSVLLGEKGYRYLAFTMEIFPIPHPESMNGSDKNRVETLGKLATDIQLQYKQHQKANLQNEKDQLKRIIDAKETQVDQIVYQLYHLTKEEITLIEA